MQRKQKKTHLTQPLVPHSQTRRAGHHGDFAYRFCKKRRKKINSPTILRYRDTRLEWPESGMERRA
jgi:hypothetical protein